MEDLCNKVSCIQVSEQTAQWIEFRKRTDRLWTDILKALRDMWGDEQADKFFEKDFEPHLLELCEAIEKGMADSIHEMLGTRGNYSLI